MDEGKWLTEEKARLDFNIDSPQLTANELRALLQLLEDAKDDWETSRDGRATEDPRVWAGYISRCNLHIHALNATANKLRLMLPSAPVAFYCSLNDGDPGSAE